MDGEYTRSDLACEALSGEDTKIAGAERSERAVNGIVIQRLCVRSADASKALQKPMGTYLTLHCGNVAQLSEEKMRVLCYLLTGELRGIAEKLTGKCINADFSVLVVGLGNAELTADAIGPKTISKLTATRHLRKHERELYYAVGCASLSALAPGVLGQTGMESAELLRQVVRVVQPDLLIAIDSLAARSCARLSSTIQISDVGIAPGSGVGNHRARISKETVGVPVLGLGIPTVVNSATLVYDALREAGIENADQSLRQVLQTGKSFFVSPKDSDLVCERASDLLSKVISMAFLGKLESL